MYSWYVHDILISIYTISFLNQNASWRSINPELVILVKKHDVTICHHRQSSSNHCHHPSSLTFTQSHTSTLSSCVHIHSSAFIFFIDHKIPKTLFRWFEFRLGSNTLCTNSSPMDYITTEFWNSLRWCWIFWYDIFAQIHSRSFRINISHEIIPTYLYSISVPSTYNLQVTQQLSVLIHPSTSTNSYQILFLGSQQPDFSQALRQAQNANMS